MRLPDPYTDSRAPGFERVTLVDNDPVLRDEMPDNTVFEVRNKGQYWSFELKYTELFEDEFRILESAILRYKSSGGFMDVLLPQFEGSRAMGDFVNATVAVGSNNSELVLNIPKLTGLPEVGDLFKLSNNYKIYKITEVTRTGENSIKIGIYPELVVLPSKSSKPQFHGILFQTKITNIDNWNSTLTPDGVYEAVTLQFRESRSK
ncbi:distal tail protein [Proteus phage Stubb]|uniref:Distal tail protein n=1 Tax=Proteus phage Stubb TaxID=2315597 RepID=A0A3B8DZV9_9CAUD|nr:distal tail protein [Proteus phage Stubb]AYJ73272.1 distal tail protein [Proteus phage Stubb]